MVYLRAISRKKNDVKASYPYHMSLINELENLEFKGPITFFIGDNGSGKTTLLETIVSLSQTVHLIPPESNPMTGPKKLSKSFDLKWSQKTFRGFYLKSQSFIYYIKNLEDKKSELQRDLDRLKEAYAHRSSYAYSLAAGPYLKALNGFKSAYEGPLLEMSHGEAYLELFKSRLVPEGLYILDEPELSLSPLKQLSLMALIKDMVKKDCQFIIITHSPILMALEESVLYNFGEDHIEEVLYDNVAHVQLTRNFLNNPGSYLKHL